MATHHRIHARDHGLRRVSRITTWVVGGGLALSGGFAALAQQAFAGRARTAAPTTSLPHTPADETSAPVGDDVGATEETPSTTDTSLQPPVTSPTQPRRHNKHVHTTSTTAWAPVAPVHHRIHRTPSTQPPVVSGGS